MKKKKFNCIIIGLGNIGMMYDYSSKNNYKLSHTSSILNSKYFSLIGGVDIDKNKRILFEKKYKLKAFNNIEKVDKKEIDLIIVCSPHETHFELVKKIIKKFKVKVILCEKPFTNNLKNAKKIKSILDTKKTKLFINYSRMSDIATMAIKKQIINKKEIFGKVFYSKSLLTNCSHFINLFNFFFGFPKKLRIISNKKNIFKLRYKKAVINFYKRDKQRSNNFFLENDNFKLDYRVKDNRITLRSNLKKRIISSYGKNINFYFIKNLENFFNNKKYNLCDIDKAIDTHKILTKLRSFN